VRSDEYSHAAFWHVQLNSAYISRFQRPTETPSKMPGMKTLRGLLLVASNEDAAPAIPFAEILP
jgi:hypothetical protein